MSTKQDFYKQIYSDSNIEEQILLGEIDYEWIKSRLDSLGLMNKHVADDLNISSSNISSWLSGKRPMSKIVKAMFFYYIKSF